MKRATVALLATLAVLVAITVPASAHHGGEFSRCERVVFGGGLRAYHVRTHNLSCNTARRFIRVLVPERFDCAYRAIDDGRIYSFRCRAGDQVFKFKAA